MIRFPSSVSVSANISIFSISFRKFRQFVLLSALLLTIAFGMSDK